MPTAHTPGVQTPAGLDINNGSPIVTGVRFTVATTTPITGIALWVPQTNTGTYTAALYQSTADDDPLGTGTGTELRTAAVAASTLTAGGWDFIPITSYTPSTGVVYTAAVHSSSGRIVATGAGLVTAITGGGVTLLADGADPNPPGLGSLRNGAFLEAASVGYPTQSFNSSDYFLDVILGNAPITLAQAVEVNSAFAMTRVKQLTLAQAVEVDAAFALGTGGLAGEAHGPEAALPGSVSYGAVSLGGAVT